MISPAATEAYDPNNYDPSNYPDFLDPSVKIASSQLKKELGYEAKKFNQFTAFHRMPEEMAKQMLEMSTGAVFSEELYTKEQI